MTEQQLEQRLRAWYRDEVGYTEPAPDGLRSSVADVMAMRAGMFRDRPFRSSRTLVLVFAILVTLAVAAALVLLSQPRPTPEPLPPPEVNLWLVIRNESLIPIDYQLTGTGGGSVGECAVGVSSDFAIAPWTLRVQGETVLTSEQGAAAYGGLATRGDVVVTISAPPTGPIEVSAPDVGTGQEVSQDRPESCAALFEPAPGVVIPAELDAVWLTGPPLREIYLNEGYVATFSPGTSGNASRLQGAVLELTDSQITFGTSPVCPSPGTYTWTLSADASLWRLSPLSDGCAERRDLFAADLERSFDYLNLPNARYFARDFGRPFTLTLPPELVPTSAGRGLGYAYYAVPGLGIKMQDTSDTMPAVCSGPDGWLTGSGGLDDPNATGPEALESLEAFRAAFEAWDLAHEAVAVTPAVDLSIGGRPAVTVDIVGTEPCEAAPGLGAGNILERDFAIDLEGGLLIIAIGPGVNNAEHVLGPPEARTYDPALLDAGDRFVRSLEFL